MSNIKKYLFVGNLFFTYENDIPQGAGYRLFDAQHMCIMLVCAIIIATFICIYCNIGADCRTKLRRDTAYTAVGLIALRMVYVYLCQAEMRYELPLHLCSIAGIMCLLYEQLKGKMPRFIKSTLEQVLFSLCLPGALLAIVFSDGTRYPAVHFITIQSNLYHVLVITYIIFLLVDGNIRPDVKEAYKSIIFLVIMVSVVYSVDRMIGANYMFLLRPSYGSPFTDVYSAFGYAGYMLCYAITVITEIYLINIIASSFMKGKGMQAC